MVKLGKILLFILSLVLISCTSSEKGKSSDGLPLNSHEHKLMLNSGKFEDMDKAFHEYWAIVKKAADEQGYKIDRHPNNFKQKHNLVQFFDTKDLDLNKKGFLIKKKYKYEEDKLASKFTLKLKFKSEKYETIAHADLSTSKNYIPKKAEIEVELDIVNADKPEGTPAIYYSAQNSVVLSTETGNTLADYRKIFPVLNTLGLDSSLEITAVNDVKAEEYNVVLGLIDFGNGLLGEMDMSAWIIDGKIIPEFSFDHPLDNWDKIPAESKNACEQFVSVLQKKAPEWCADGNLKSSFVFNR